MLLGAPTHPFAAGLVEGACQTKGSSMLWARRLVPLPWRSSVLLLATNQTDEFQCGVHANPTGLPTGACRSGNPP